MTSADTCQCVRLGTLLLVRIFRTDDDQCNVSHKWRQKWANSSTKGNLSWTTLYAAFVILVECLGTKFKIFSLGISVGYAAGLSAKLLIRKPMLFPRLQKSGKNGISTFLRSPLLIIGSINACIQGTPLGVLVW